MPIVINTPAGHIGSRLTQLLLEAGEKPTLITRNPAKVATFAAEGAQVVKGDIEDGATLEAAFAGACTLFWLSPPNVRPDHAEWRVGLAKRAAAQAKAAGITHIVVLSSVGAHSGPGTGPVAALRDIEIEFLATGLNVLVLRPGFFMENHFNNIPTIARQGAIYAPLAPDIAFPLVATRDIADVAARWMLAGWDGQRVLGIHGPTNLSYAQQAEIIGREWGKPVNFVEITASQFIDAMTGMGAPRFLAEMYAEMYDGMRNGKMRAAEPRSPETTTTTSFSRFVRETLKPALDGFPAA